MANLVSKATGNLTANTTWAAVSFWPNTSEVESTTAAVSTSNQDTTTFTPPNSQVDALLVKFGVNTTPTGTFSVTLRNSTTGTNIATVTVNVSDLPATGWVVFPITAHTPNGTDQYLFRLTKSSTTGTLSVYTTNSSNFNWICGLRLVGDVAPAASDKLIIAGEHTGAGTGNSFTVTNNSPAVIQAATFAGSVDYLTKSHVASQQLGTSDFAFCGWVYLTNKTNSQMIIRKGLATGNTRSYIIYYDQPSDRFVFAVSSDGTALTSVSATTFGSPSTGTWYFIAAWRDTASNLIKICVNDGGVDTTALSGATSLYASTDPLSIGAISDGSTPITGRIGPFGFWKKAISSGEITSLFNSGNAKLFNNLDSTELTSLYSYWNMQEASGSVRTDFMGVNPLANNGTVGLGAGPCTAVSFGPTWATSDTISPGGVQVCKRGTFTHDTAANKNYGLKWKGRFAIYDQATVNIGTSGTRVPATSNAIYEMDSAANVDSGLVALAGSTLNIYGHNGRLVQTLMTSDKAVAATTLVTTANTGWIAGDDLAIASTSRTPGDCEKKVISSVDSSTQVTLTAGLSAAHSGTSPTQAEVMNLTRNVRFRGVSSTLCGYVNLGSTAVVVIDYAEFYQLGSSTGGKLGIDVGTNTGSLTFTNNSVRDNTVSGCYGLSINSSTANNITVQYNCFYNHWSVALRLVATSNASITIDTNWMMRTTGANGYLAIISDVGITFTNNRIIGSGLYGLAWGEGQYTGTAGTFSGNVVHSNLNFGFDCSYYGRTRITITNLASWRNNGPGLLFGSNLAGSAGLIFESPIFFGNSGANVQLFHYTDSVFNNMLGHGDTTFSTTANFQFTSSGSVGSGHIVLNSLDSSASGIKTAPTNEFLFSLASTFVEIQANNCKFGASTIVSGANNMSDYSYVSSQRHGQSAGDHRTYVKTGTITSDTTIYNTASPSQRITPSNASSKIDSAGCGYARGMLYRVDNGATVTPTVYVRKSAAGDGAAYNGNQPRLILKRNDALGVTADTVLATYSAGTGSWNSFSGTSPAATDDGVFEIVVDCDGTAGWINVADWGGS